MTVSPTARHDVNMLEETDTLDNAFVIVEFDNGCHRYRQHCHPLHPTFRLGMCFNGKTRKERRLQRLTACVNAFAAGGPRMMLELCMFAEASKNQEEVSVVGDAGE